MARQLTCTVKLLPHCLNDVCPPQIRQMRFICMPTAVGITSIALRRRDRCMPKHDRCCQASTIRKSSQRNKDSPLPGAQYSRAGRCLCPLSLALAHSVMLQENIHKACAKLSKGLQNVTNSTAVPSVCFSAVLRILYSAGASKCRRIHRRHRLCLKFKSSSGS